MAGSILIVATAWSRQLLQLDLNFVSIQRLLPARFTCRPDMWRLLQVVAALLLSPGELCLLGCFLGWMHGWQKRLDGCCPARAPSRGQEFRPASRDRPLPVHPAPPGCSFVFCNAYCRKACGEEDQRPEWSHQNKIPPPPPPPPLPSAARQLNKPASTAAGLASALSTWGRVPDEREINFYQSEGWQGSGIGICVLGPSLD